MVLPQQESSSSSSIKEEIRQKYAPWGSGQRNGYTPLHMAMMSIAPIADIRCLLVEADDGAAALVHQDTQDGFTPLHLAAQRYAYNPMVIQTLVDSCPDAAKIADFKEQKLPLHYAIKNQEQASLGAVLALIGAYPAAAATADASGQTPVHLGIIQKSSTQWSDDAIKAMLDRYPPAATIKYKHWTPLHWVMGTATNSGGSGSGGDGSSTTRIIRVLLDKYPSAVLELDGDGRTPLHVGMAMGAGVESISLLVNHHQAADGEKAASIVDHDGWIPLQHGIRNKAPPESINVVRLVSPELPRAAGSRKPYEMCSSW